MRITGKLLVPALLFVRLSIGAVITYNVVITMQQFDAVTQERLENMSSAFCTRPRAKEDLVAAREPGHAPGREPTLVALDPAALSRA